MTVQPPGEGPAMWEIWPSGSLFPLGCTAAVDASYCSLISAQASRALSRPATDRSAILRKKAFSCEKAFSIGFKSGL